MLSRRVDLRFPIEIPGGRISSVTARPISGGEFHLMHCGEEGAWQAFANSLRLPADIVMRLDQSDHFRIVDAIADLSAEAVAQTNGQSRPALAVVPGGGQ